MISLDNDMSSLYYVQRSTDRNRTSKQLIEEAERYFEGFISNVEDTDLSSFDGERSDGSSTLGGMSKPRDSTFGNTENFQSPAGIDTHPVEMEGVILPWLQWETSNDGSILDKNRKNTPITPKTLQWDAEQVSSVLVFLHYHGIHTLHPYILMLHAR